MLRKNDEVKCHVNWNDKKEWKRKKYHKEKGWVKVRENLKRSQAGDKRWTYTEDEKREVLSKDRKWEWHDIPHFCRCLIHLSGRVLDMACVSWRDVERSKRHRFCTGGDWGFENTENHKTVSTTPCLLQTYPIPQRFFRSSPLRLVQPNQPLENDQ